MDNQGSVEVNYVLSAGCVASDSSRSGLFLTLVYRIAKAPGADARSED